MWSVRFGGWSTSCPSTPLEEQTRKTKSEKWQQSNRKRRNTHENAEKHRKRKKSQKNTEKRRKTQKNIEKRRNASKSTPLMAPWALPGHVLVTLGRSWDALGSSWAALGALLGRSWGSWKPLGRLLDASCEKAWVQSTCRTQLGGQNPPKLAQETSKNQCRGTN